MRPLFRSVLVILAVTASASLVLTQSAPPQSGRSDAARLARGKYIVDRVAICGDCHTPRTTKGEPDGNRYLQGADMGVEPVVPLPIFTRMAPDITAKGLAGWSVEDLTKTFQTGRRPTGEPFRPPMPGYRLTRRDAEAVALYLKSVGWQQR